VRARRERERASVRQREKKKIEILSNQPNGGYGIVIAEPVRETMWRITVVICYISMEGL